MIKTLFKGLIILFGMYVGLCVLLYCYQEQLIFHPQKLTLDYEFEFEPEFEELNFKTPDNKLLSGLLFKAKKPKGVIFYLHGNAGSLKIWGNLAKHYTHLNYDVYMIDYRGYGKSEGSISGQDQFFKDNQLAYDLLKERYREKNIIVLGYSIGTGPAAKIAATNQPKLLILQAPYYNLNVIMDQWLPFVPDFILKYPFPTNEYLKSCKMPVVIFHGTKDKVIDYESSQKLEDEFKKQDTLISLEGQGHKGITENIVYKKALIHLLADE